MMMMDSVPDVVSPADSQEAQWRSQQAWPWPCQPYSVLQLRALCPQGNWTFDFDLGLCILILGNL